jgi:hypothetical protein
MTLRRRKFLIDLFEDLASEQGVSGRGKGGPNHMEGAMSASFTGSLVCHQKKAGKRRTSEMTTVERTPGSFQPRTLAVVSPSAGGAGRQQKGQKL